MIQFIIPIVITATKLVVKHYISEGIADGVSQAKFEVERKITKSMVSTLINIAVNIVLLVFAVYFLPLAFGKEIVIYVVCSVYLGSIIYASYSVVKNFPMMFKYVFEHKLNLRDYIYDEIYSEAHNEVSYQIRNKNFFSRALNGIFGEPASAIAFSIANSTTSIVIQKVTSIVIMLTIVFIAYVVIFRILAAPILIENATHLNVFQAALYPLLYTVDYFFGTNVLSWLI